MIIPGSDTQILIDLLEKAVYENLGNMDFIIAGAQQNLLDRIKAESEKNRHEYNAGNDPFYVRRNLDASLEFLKAFERFIKQTSDPWTDELVKAYRGLNSAIERTPQVELK